MSNAVATIERNEVAVVSKDDLVNYLKTFGGANQLTQVEAEQFISIAQAFNLNPFKREIYAVAYSGNGGRKLSIITGYEVYLKRAERLGMLDGWEVSIEGTGENTKAVLTVFRKDWSHPFKHEAYFDEVAKKGQDGKSQSMWKTMPRFMLKKVAMAQGFRLCFPDEFGGMPYTADELPDNMTTGFANMADSAKESVKEPEYIPPAKPAEAKQPAPKPAVEPKQAQPAKGVTVSEGELIPGDYWKLNAEGKRAMIGEGFKAEKIEGAWICVRKAS